ncbi:hypothetical protein SRHO_G00138320 [Serrasalmus rhombeus]
MHRVSISPTAIHCREKPTANVELVLSSTLAAFQPLYWFFWFLSRTSSAPCAFSFCQHMPVMQACQHHPFSSLGCHVASSSTPPEQCEGAITQKQTRVMYDELKKQLEMRRMQMAAQGVMGGQQNSDSDPVEERLRNQIEEEKKSYKSTFGRLKGLKTEIEHLQHLLHKSKIKLQKDFQDWWTQEATKLQKDQRPESVEVKQSLNSTTRHSSSPDHAISTQERKLRDLPAPSARDLRALSSTALSPSSIPLTGDQQTDADIMAFIKARQSLLTKTGTS